MSLVIIPCLMLLILAFGLGREFGKDAGKAHVFNQVRSYGRCFDKDEVLVGNTVTWHDYEQIKANEKGTVEGVAAESRNANAKHQTSVKIRGTYRHPFLNAETEE